MRIHYDLLALFPLRSLVEASVKQQQKFKNFLHILKITRKTNHQSHVDYEKIFKYEKDIMAFELLKRVEVYTFFF